MWKVTNVHLLLTGCNGFSEIHLSRQRICLSQTGHFECFSWFVTSLSSFTLLQRHLGDHNASCVFLLSQGDRWNHCVFHKGWILSEVCEEFMYIQMRFPSAKCIERDIEMYKKLYPTLEQLFIGLCKVSAIFKDLPENVVFLSCRTRVTYIFKKRLRFTR